MSVAFGNFFGPDTLVIFLIILLLCGGRRAGEFGRGLGDALREFRKAKDDFQDEPGSPWDWVDWLLIATMLALVGLGVLAALTS
jgi:sec-independent protein translocase protein TatA